MLSAQASGLRSLTSTVDGVNNCDWGKHPAVLVRAANRVVHGVEESEAPTGLLLAETRLYASVDPHNEKEGPLKGWQYDPPNAELSRGDSRASPAPCFDRFDATRRIGPAEVWRPTAFFSAASVLVWCKGVRVHYGRSG